jgi:hypothetical protein
MKQPVINMLKGIYKLPLVLIWSVMSVPFILIVILEVIGRNSPFSEIKTLDFYLYVHNLIREL